MWRLKCLLIGYEHKGHGTPSEQESTGAGAHDTNECVNVQFMKAIALVSQYETQLFTIANLSTVNLYGLNQRCLQ